MGNSNKIGLTPGAEISTKKFKEIFEKFSKGSNKVDKETALKFLKNLAEESKIEYSEFKANEILNKIDPYEVGLDRHRFQVFFFESTEDARQEGSLKFSESMHSSGN